MSRKHKFKAHGENSCENSQKITLNKLPSLEVDTAFTVRMPEAQASSGDTVPKRFLEGPCAAQSLSSLAFFDSPLGIAQLKRVQSIFEAMLFQLVGFFVAYSAFADRVVRLSGFSISIAHVFMVECFTCRTSFKVPVH
eukprot:1709394-Amphidinium_carterae.1